MRREQRRQHLSSAVDRADQRPVAPCVVKRTAPRVPVMCTGDARRCRAHGVCNPSRSRWPTPCVYHPGTISTDCRPRHISACGMLALAGIVRAAMETCSRATAHARTYGHATVGCDGVVLPRDCFSWRGVVSGGMTRAHERSGQVARKRRCLRLVYGRRLAATHDSWLPPAQRVQAPPEPAEIWEVSSATRIDDGYGIQLPVTWKRDVRLAIRVRDGRGNEHYGLLYMPLAALLFDHAGPGPHPAERLFRRCEQDVWRAGSDSNRDAEPVGDAVQVV